MLDVIGAGATAHSDIDWHSAWKNSPERQDMESELNILLQQRNDSPVVVKGGHPEFAASFSVQFFELTRRAFLNYIRSPTYLMSKYAINIFAGGFFTPIFGGALH
jgi:ATP-binding cassette subfamily G (WHITE) protein 2 (SNQ2)